MPLAIELAAARLGTLSLSEIAARLDNRFEVLVSGRRAALPRHQTLRALIDWSYDSLGPTGEACISAVECVCRRLGAATGRKSGRSGDIQQLDVRSVLTQLVRKSIVIAEERDGATPFRNWKRCASTRWNI